MTWFSARSTPVIAVAAAAVISAAPWAHEVADITADPGFRPDSDYASVFVEAVPAATIAVHPTIVRRSSRTAHSFSSQRQIIDSLNEQSLAVAVQGGCKISLGRIEAASQWELFRHGMQRIAHQLEGRRSGADYDLFMEFLLPVNDESIFGIQLYILDRDGHNAFSLLLNSHHRLFVDAGLVADDSTEEARDRLMEKATQAGIEALSAQIGRASH